MVLSSCASKGSIPNPEICIEIPFIDGQEGACSQVTVNKQRLVNKEEWAKMRPYMLSIHAKHWADIKVNWKKACRGMQECEQKLDSVDKVITDLDKVLKNLYPKGVE